MKKRVLILQSIRRHNWASIISALLFLVIYPLAPGFSGEGPDPSTELQPSHKVSIPITLRIIIRWSGDDFASKQDLETRGKIETLIAERGVGRIVRRGTGMGWMDIWVEVRDRESAKKAIDKIMAEAVPNSEYLLE